MSKDTMKSIVKHIEKSKRTTTILFTDIERSTRFWDKHGDTVGRLMVDSHNKLMFPIVRTFNGTVIKTIGDSIMASFRTPRDAVCAAIAMQQLLQSRRRKLDEFKFRVRIGIHTGRAIIEQSDIFGDVVNMASRIESEAVGGEILVSESTIKEIQDPNVKKAFYDRRRFVPKGKREPLVVYKCNWLKHPDITDQVKTERLLPMPTRQKLELLVYFGVIVFTLWIVWRYFIRYFLADIEFFALYLLDPHPVVPLLFLVGLIELVVIVRPRIHRIPALYFQLLKGGFGFSMIWLLVFLITRVIGAEFGPSWKTILFRSDHLFVKIVADEVNIYSAPSVQSKVIGRSGSGSLFLQSQVLRIQRHTWTKVLLERGGHRFGYLLRMAPSGSDSVSVRQTLAGKFYIRMYDLIGLLLGLAGFLWGMFTFRLRPI